MPDRRVTFKMLDKEKRRRVTTCAVYFAILLLGILIGLIPYLLHYVKESRADREVFREFMKRNATDYRIQLASLEAKVNKLMKKQGPSSMAMTSKTIKTIEHKRASVTGSTNMTLLCEGNIKVVGVKLNGVAAEPNDVKKFDSFCQHDRARGNDQIACQVSMESVMGFKLGDLEFTEVIYNCEKLP